MNRLCPKFSDHVWMDGIDTSKRLCMNCNLRLTHEQIANYQVMLEGGHEEGVAKIINEVTELVKTAGEIARQQDPPKENGVWELDLVHVEAYGSGIRLRAADTVYTREKARWFAKEIRKTLDGDEEPSKEHMLTGDWLRFISILPPLNRYGWNGRTLMLDNGSGKAQTAIIPGSSEVAHALAWVHYFQRRFMAVEPGVLEEKIAKLKAIYESMNYTAPEAMGERLKHMGAVFNEESTT